ncbi:MAG: type II toxin-antitoxin system ParD family antitoxin [Saprospiraceae bacterium]|nr:type II toxin-antitoxin system ParD family antitoxin [Saprospiraceae bacterium]
MQRVNLGKPYEEFIQKLVQSGYYASASEVLRDALRLKMEQSEMWQGKRLQQLVQEGLDDVEAGKVVPFDENFWDNINARVAENIKNNRSIPDHVRP